MKFEIALASIFAVFLMFAPASAAPFVMNHEQIRVKNDLIDVQYSRGNSREFRSCMRAKYGPRYFNRVPRTHRFHMVQACGG